MRLGDRLLAYFRPPRIATADALRTFLQERASLIAQKCAIDYCRGKTGLASYALFTERPFLDALDICRWEAYAAVLGDLLIVVEGQLRPHAHAEEPAALQRALLDLYRTALGRLPAPAHRAHGWDDAIASFEAHLAAASRNRPQRALDVADRSAKRLFDTLPIHARYRELDEEVVYGAVRFRMIAVSAEMERRFSPAELARHLVS